MEKANTEWARCPICGNKTRLQLRVDTELKNFPLYCPKCRRESLIGVKDLYNCNQRARCTDAELIRL